MCFMIAVYWLIEGSEDPAKELKKEPKWEEREFQMCVQLTSEIAEVQAKNNDYWPLTNPDWTLKTENWKLGLGRVRESVVGSRSSFVDLETEIPIVNLSLGCCAAAALQQRSPTRFDQRPSL